MKYFDDEFLLAARTRAESRIGAIFDIKQLSRKEYCIIGCGTIFEPKYEKLVDSLGNSHYVKVGDDKIMFEITDKECDDYISILDGDFEKELFGEEYSNFVLHFPINPILNVENDPSRFIAKHLINGTDSCVLRRQFIASLFYGKDSFLKKDFMEKGLRVGESEGHDNSLKSIITGEVSNVKIGQYYIEAKSLFEYWWTPKIRKLLKKDEWDYPQIYNIDDGLTALTELFKIRSKLTKKARLIYEY